MSTDKDDLSIDDDFVAADDDAEPQVETAKTNPVSYTHLTLPTTPYV